MQPPTRVLIVAENKNDAHRLVRQFEQFPEFLVVKASTVVGGIDPEKFDVGVIHGENLTHLAAILRAGVPTLCLIPRGVVRPEGVNGPNAVLPTDAPPAQIRAAAIALAAGLQIGQTRHDRAVAGEPEFAIAEPLTDRELEILNLVADGLTNPEIARQLNISRNTVKFHVSSIISKLGATSRTEAVTIGLKRGLLMV